MTILQNGLDIQRFSQTAPRLRTQVLLLDFQVDQSFQLILRRTASVYREHGHHPDSPAVRNLDTFHPDFLLDAWLVYGRGPPFLTVSPVCKFEPVRTYPIIILKIACLKPLFVNSSKAVGGVTFIVNSFQIGFMNSQNRFSPRPPTLGLTAQMGQGLQCGWRWATWGLLRADGGLFLTGEQIDLLTEFIHQENQFSNSLRIHVFCPLVAGNLICVGIDHVDAGVQGMVQLR